MALQVVTAIWGDAYGDDYVRAIRHQVPDIVVLGRDRALLEPTRYRGWWCKLETFRPENSDLRPCLFIDLDTFILGELAPLREVSNELWLIKNFNAPKKSNSGLFVAPATELADKIWDGSRRMDTVTHGRGAGDGDYLARFAHRLLTDEFPDILSYKVNQLYESPKNARIICFHGKPKPHATDGWAQQHWQELIHI